MRSSVHATAWGRMVRLGALAAGAFALAGCATGYSLVQPDAAGSGSYYTSNGPYANQGYDDYGTGPYYPGTSGYGYDNGVGLYANPYGWFGGYYGNYGYWPSFGLGLGFGFSNAWNYPGYWGPWYSTVFPVYGCWHGCRHGHRGHYYHGRHDHQRNGNGGMGSTSRQPFNQPGGIGAPRRYTNGAPPIAVPERAREDFANRRPLVLPPGDVVHTPVGRQGFVRSAARVPVEAPAMSRGMMSMPNMRAADPMPAMRAPMPMAAPGSFSPRSFSPPPAPAMRAMPAPRMSMPAGRGGGQSIKTR